MRKHKLNDTTKKISFYMVDKSDGKTPLTNNVPAVSVSLNGSTLIPVSGVVSETGLGIYKLTPAITDVNILGPAVFVATANGAINSVIETQIVAYDPYDVNALGLSRLDAKISSRSSHDAAGVVTAILAANGITVGGTWTLSKILKVLTAHAVGLVQEKAGFPGVEQVLDPEDNTTVIAEITLSSTTPYRSVTVL